MMKDEDRLGEMWSPNEKGEEDKYHTPFSHVSNYSNNIITDK